MKEQQGMKYEDALSFIEECNLLGSIPGLDSIRDLADRIGNPQDELKFIHVAGTNGKGSVSSFIATVLQLCGLRIGRYISPTIYTYRERFQINGKMIGKKELGEEMSLMKEACDALVSQGKPHPTSFEIETALAFHYFYKKQCDIVVLETGMGGTLDATNIIKDPLMCVLTSISMDHMQFLGDTLSKIAENKCGIIKGGSRVVCAMQPDEAETVVMDVCREKNASLVFADASQVEYIPLGKAGKPSLEKQAFLFEGERYEISLLGKYQIENAVTAIKALQELRTIGYTKITDEKIKKGLLDTQWKGRFSLLAGKPYFVADGAHNVAAAKKLAESIRFYFTNRKIVYIMGMWTNR